MKSSVSGNSSPYSVEEICPSVWAIDSSSDESMYLIEGSERSLLIDTGSDSAPVMPLVSALTGKPAELALTHAHFDHMYHCDEFASVYLHRKDMDAWNVLSPQVLFGTLGSGKKPKRYRVKGYTPVYDGSVLSLGGRDIRVIDAPGHTPGSVVFADEQDRLLFTGDAFGSGSYAWMWMPGCLCLSEYISSLSSMISALEPYRDFRMLGGHRRQGMIPNSDPYAHELTLDTVIDMRTLCAKILSGELSPVETERIFGAKTFTYRYGLAGIVITKGKIR